MKRIYEIINKGKGVIQSITPSNLLKIEDDTTQNNIPLKVNILSTDLATNDISGFVTYINELNPPLTVLEINSLVQYYLTDTNDIYQFAGVGKGIYGQDNLQITSSNVIKFSTSGATPPLQEVIEAGDELVADDNLRKIVISKEGQSIAFYSRADVGDAWSLKSTHSLDGIVIKEGSDNIVQIFNDAGEGRVSVFLPGSGASSLAYNNLNFTEGTDSTTYYKDRIQVNSETYSLPTGASSPLATLLDLASVVVSSNETAENDTNYTVVANATFTDPTPIEGKGYVVFVRNGTATIGGTGYGVGSLVYRVYHSGAWNNTVFVNKTYVDAEISNAVAGLLDDRGNYDASSNLFPSTGGSGSSGTILKGDLWTVSVAGTLGGNSVTVGDVIRALVDTPGQTSSNWVVTENNIGYVPENNANKTDVMSGNTTSSTKFLSAKGVYDFVTGLVVSATSLIAGISKLYSDLGSNTDGSITQKAITDELALRDKRIVKITTPSSAVTGTTSQTQVTSFNFEIEGNTFINGDILRIAQISWFKSGTNNASTCRLKLSNTNDYATASDVLILAASGGNINLKGTRSYDVKTGQLEGLMSSAANGIFNDNIPTSIATSTLSIDWTQKVYGFVSLQVTNGSDAVNMKSLVIEKI